MKPKCNYIFIMYFNTLINKSIKQVEERKWELHLPTKQKCDKHNIKPITLPIFHNYQHQPCLFSPFIPENKNSNERDPQI